MSSTHSVIVSGLPEFPKLNRLVFLMRGILKRQGVQKLWVKGMSKMDASNLNFATIDFYSLDDANRAAECLQGYNLHFGNDTFLLTAHLEDSAAPGPSSQSKSQDQETRQYSGSAEVTIQPRSYNYSKRGGHGNSGKRPQSRSPSSLDTSKLDLEIELLKKRRLIVEEERRLLFEQKKLELMKSFGPSAIRDLNELQSKFCDLQYMSQTSPDQHIFTPPGPHMSDLQMEPQPSPGTKKWRPRVRSKRFSPYTNHFNVPLNPEANTRDSNEHLWASGLPQFVGPCKAILREMDDYIKKHSRKHENKNLCNLIRGIIRNRLAMILDKKPILKTDEVLIAYREKHPVSTDETLVIQQVKDLRACHLPEPKLESNGKVKKKANKQYTSTSKSETEALFPTQNVEVNEENLKKEISPCETKDEAVTSESKPETEVLNATQNVEVKEDSGQESKIKDDVDVKLHCEDQIDLQSKVDIAENEETTKAETEELMSKIEVSNIHQNVEVKEEDVKPCKKDDEPNAIQIESMEEGIVHASDPNNEDCVQNGEGGPNLNPETQTTKTEDSHPSQNLETKENEKPCQDSVQVDSVEKEIVHASDHNDEDWVKDGEGWSELNPEQQVTKEKNGE